MTATPDRAGIAPPLKPQPHGREHHVMRAHTIPPDTDSLSRVAMTARTALPTPAPRSPINRLLWFSQLFILPTPSAHLPSKAATPHTLPTFIPELTIKSNNCLTLRHLFHMHLLHSSIA